MGKFSRSKGVRGERALVSATKMLQSAKQAYLFNPSSYTHDAFVKAGHIETALQKARAEIDRDWGCPVQGTQYF